MSKSILVVDDESSIRDMLRMALEAEGFVVDEANNARNAQNQVSAKKPNLILLDWMMPGVSGVELVRRFKESEATRNIPIIMLTAKEGDDNSIQALDLGTDDYITKPFSPRALIARINAVLRRTNTNADNKHKDATLISGNILIDTLSHRVTVNNEPLELSPTEFRLLQFFINNSGRVFSRNQLLDSVWGESVYVEDRTVDVHIRRLRKILEPVGVSDYIHTVRGVGYRFEPTI